MVKYIYKNISRTKTCDPEFKSYMGFDSSGINSMAGDEPAKRRAG
jgi:hypothetical protein